jgi:membrane protein DedA with SNARE-associated domain
VELFEFSLLGIPLAVIVAVVGSVASRHLAPIGLMLLGLVVGGVVGRVAYEEFADPPLGFEFGSEFEGYDWIAGFASVGTLLGAVGGSWLVLRLRRRRTSTV